MLGQQRGPKQQGPEAISLLKMLQALEINQAAVSQLKSRNTIQGHEGELSNTAHSSFLLLLHFLKESYCLEDQLVQNL